MKTLSPGISKLHGHAVSNSASTVRRIQSEGDVCGAPAKKIRLLGGSGAAADCVSVPGGLCGGERNELPIARGRRRLIQELHKSNTSIIVGETACGKTTQIPQYIYQNGLHHDKTIACTQPRRVSAITVAKRVSEEMGVNLGDLVGYSVRFEDMSSSHTRIRYMTDGMLLREATGDPLMRRYSFVILDEAHERTLHTDVLFGVVKRAQRERQHKGNPLKVIVMSATMNVDHFSRYFENAPVFYVQGRQYPIQLFYAPTHQSDYLYSALVSVFQLHEDLPHGHHILVFLTGQDEIENLLRLIRQHAKSSIASGEVFTPITALPLYASLPIHLQMKAFAPVAPGVRKVILSTNIAETSVTITGVKVIIDTGKVKTKSFNPDNGLDMLKVTNVSKAQALQRMGRAGREGPGSCYRIYTQQEFQKFSDYTRPEIQRCSLETVVLQLLSLGITDVVNFDFMDKPSTQSLEHAVRQLEMLGAIEKESTLKLTEIGRQLSAFPLNPHLAKVVLVAKDCNCLEEILSIVALLSSESVFVSISNKREEAKAAHQKFISEDGDHVTLLNVFRAYNATKEKKHWCFENFLNVRHLNAACDVKRQLKDICERLQLPIKSCGHNTTVLRKCLVYGYFMNAAELTKEGTYRTIGSHKPVAIHPSSALFMCKPVCIIYNEIIETTKCYMRNVSVIDPEWLHEASPSYLKTENITEKERC